MATDRDEVPNIGSGKFVESFLAKYWYDVQPHGAFISSCCGGSFVGHDFAKPVVQVLRYGCVVIRNEYAVG